ncbi:MAG: MotA/TolQ/ExbB proton channel family protein [Cellvibrionaceae bacterium]
MDTVNTIIEFFKNGGPFMVPIAIVLFIGLAIALERFLFLTYAKTSNKLAFNRILPLLKKKNYKDVVNFGQNSRAPIARVIAAGVARMTQSPRRDDIELAMEEGVLEAMPRLERRTPYLATLANIATLLGLLGTIIGLIAAFESVANADPAEKATQLSSSISIAMNTTAFGLIAAIPLLFLHAILQNKTTDIIDGLEMASVKCLNMMSRGTGAASSQTRSSDK